MLENAKVPKNIESIQSSLPIMSILKSKTLLDQQRKADDDSMKILLSPDTENSEEVNNLKYSTYPQMIKKNHDFR